MAVVESLDAPVVPCAMTDALLCCDVAAVESYGASVGCAPAVEWLLSAVRGAAVGSGCSLLRLVGQYLQEDRDFMSFV